ncbi:integrase, partial [Schaalia georgiae]
MGRSQSTFNNYSRHVASVSLHFGKIPTELDSEQNHD